MFGDDPQRSLAQVGAGAALTSIPQVLAHPFGIGRVSMVSELSLRP